MEKSYGHEVIALEFCFLLCDGRDYELGNV
jgi:hypothetical protein